MQQTKPYHVKHAVRFVTASSLFDGHDSFHQHYETNFASERCRGHPLRAITVRSKM